MPGHQDCSVSMHVHAMSAQRHRYIAILSLDYNYSSLARLTGYNNLLYTEVAI